MANPPAIVKLALESICLLLNATDDNEVVPDWKTIRSILNKENFISSILNFETVSITYVWSHHFFLNLFLFLLRTIELTQNTLSFARLFT